MTTLRKLIVVTAVLPTLACDAEPGYLDPGELTAQEEVEEIVANLLLADYPKSEIEVTEDGVVIVGKDAVVGLEASREMVPLDKRPTREDGDSFRQYRTSNLVDRDLSTICVNGSTFSGTLSAGLDQAIANYNGLDLTFNMVRTNGSSWGCDATITGYVVAGEGGSAGFPSGGEPFGAINIGLDVASYGLGVATHVITHELGHCIGFRHSDYYNRSISCSGPATNEGPAGVGAVHIPGTPTGATYNGSVMNSCYNAGSTGTWSTGDRVALDVMYGIPPAFREAVASFRGTLNMANLDDDGHYLVRVADVTGDGRADLVSVHDSGSAYVWPGQWNGAFGGAVSSFAGTLDVANIDGSGHYIVGVADVTGDGRADLVSAHTGGTAYVWPGQSNGTFGGAVASFAGTLNLANLDGSGHFIVDVADVTGDGRADLVSAGTDGTAYVWPGQSSGSFGGAVASFAGTLNLANLDGTGHYIVAVSDVTGDGRADLVSSGTDGTAYVWPGRWNGRFGSAVASFAGTLNMANLDGTGHYLVDVADVTGDGRADLVSAADDGSAYVWPGHSNGKFMGAIESFDGTLNVANLDGSGHFIVDVSDVNGDGHADLVSSHTNGTAYVWPGR